MEENQLLEKYILDYALDCHTSQGKRAGKTKQMFFREEFDALTPREPGLFDQDLLNRDQRKE